MKNESLLMNCRVCGAEIAKSAKICPQCGAKNKIQPKSPRGCLWVILILVVCTIIGGVSQQSKSESTATSKSIDVVFNATQFIIGGGKTVSESELIEMLGRPEKTDEWNYKSYQVLIGREAQYPIRSLIYEGGKYEYMFNNDMLQRISIEDNIPYESKDAILAMFGLKVYADTKIQDNNVSYRATDCGVPDFWISDMNEDDLNLIKITYGTDLFGE